MRKIKLLHVITGLNAGGAETMLYELLLNTDKNKFDLYVVSMLDQGFFGERIQALGIPVYCLEMQKSTPSIKALFKYRQIIKKIRPNIVQGWMYHANLLVVLGKIFLDWFPIVLGIHSSLLDFSREKMLTKWVIKANALGSYFANKVINCSMVSQKQHESIGFRKKNSFYIPNGFDTDIFTPSREQNQIMRQKLGIDVDTKIMAMFARFHSQKNHQGFLEIAQRIKRTYHRNTKFLMAGEAIDKNNVLLLAKIKELKLEEDVLLLGYVKTADYMPAVDLLVCPSSWGEAFPMVIGEAMACGVPCVATDVGDCKLIIGDYGSVVAVGDYQTLVNQCIKWLDISEEWKMKIRQHVIDNYAIQHIVDQYEKLYVNL